MNCKPGDRARLVNAKLPENIGRIVEVLSFAGHWDNLDWWRARSCANPLRCVPHYAYRQEFFVPDEWLRPLQAGEAGWLPAPLQGEADAEAR
jgi:hypothetical protein